MKLSFSTAGCTALYPGAGSEADTFLADGRVDPTAALPKCRRIPVMTARRLTAGNKLALECALSLLDQAQPAALLFASRHSELEHNYHILKALAARQDVSPTDFTMSVHNSAAGSLTILKKLPIVSSAVSAGADSFAALLTDACAMLQDGLPGVLAVCFDSIIPDFYQPYLAEGAVTWPHAAAVMLTKGREWTVELRPAEDQAIPETAESVPMALQFYRQLTCRQSNFTLRGQRFNLHCRHHETAEDLH